MALDELDYALLDARVGGSVSSRLFLNLLVPVGGDPKQIAAVGRFCRVEPVWLFGVRGEGRGREGRRGC